MAVVSVAYFRYSIQLFFWSIIFSLTPADAQAVESLRQAPLLEHPDFNINNSIYAFARQPNGGIIIGGAFSTVRGQQRERLARILPDGNLDPNWKPSVGGGVVRTIAVDPLTGEVFVGGQFTAVNGVSWPYLARFSGSGAGTHNRSWNFKPNGSVLTLAVDRYGTVYAGGNFQTINNVSYPRLARIYGRNQGTLDMTWRPALDGQVNSIALDNAGAVFVGGWFLNVNQQSRRRLAKISTAAGAALDTQWNPNSSGVVYAIALDRRGSLYVGGNFLNIDGQPRLYIAKVSTSGAGALDLAWNPNVNSVWHHITMFAVDRSNSLYVGGPFHIQGGHVSHVSTEYSGEAVVEWIRYTNRPPETFLLNPADDAIYIGGHFFQIDGQSRQYFAALSDELHTIFNANFE